MSDDAPCTIGIKIPFTPKGGRFCEEFFLHYLDLCYVDHAIHKLKTANQSEASRNWFLKICHHWGKGYFAALVTLILKTHIEITIYDLYCNI